jgi:SET family sugar efflux transporter-like MFS transporter
MRRVVDFLRRLVILPWFPGVLAASFALGMASSLVVPFMSMWGTLHVGMSPRGFGVFMTMTYVSAITISTLLARWSDSHVTRRTMLMVGSIAGMLGYLGYAFVTDIVALTLIGSLLVGVATVNFSQLFAFVRDEIGRPENVGMDGAFFVTVLRVSFSLAWTIGPAIGAWVMVHFGYRGIFVSAAGLFGVFLAGVLCFVPDRPHAREANAKRLPLRRVFTRGDILGYFAGFVLLFAAFNISIMNLPLMVTQAMGGTERQVGIIYSIAPIFEVPLMLWFGHLAARGRQVALIRFGVLVAALYFTALFFARAPWQIYPMQILSAISIAITTNVTITFFQDLLPGQAGVATSVYSNSFSGGSLVGYFAFGLIVEPLGYRGVFVVCGLLCLVTLAILLRQTQGAPTRAAAAA